MILIIYYIIIMTDNIQIEIQEILDTNKISDLKRFIKKRQSLNSYNK